MIRAVKKGAGLINWNKLNFWLWFWSAFLVGLMVGIVIGEKNKEVSSLEIQNEQQKVDYGEQVKIYKAIPDTTDDGYWQWMHKR